jgi:thiosulfate/3-mercaptopyruvate sulfurtransferase
MRRCAWLFGLTTAGFSLMADAAPVWVDGAWLAARLGDPKLVLIDMSDDDAQYQRFHLPGARRLPYAALVKPRDVQGCTSAAGAGCAGAAKIKIKTRLDDHELALLLGRLGLTRDRHVVIYDDLGGLNAARLFWELERVGHPAVSVLDGGLVQWILDGRKVVNNAPKPLPGAYRIEGKRRSNEATLADVRAFSENGGVLLDVRSEEEYVGEARRPRTGHVPGARFWPWEQAVDFDKGFTRQTGDAVRASLRQVGAGDPAAPVIAYCRSGHRAAQTYLTLRGLGYENVRLYANSMNEYGLARDAPLKPGKQP